MGSIEKGTKMPALAPFSTPPDHQDRTAKPTTTTSIDLANEVTGLKLLLVHLGMCICTFLIGLDFNIIATAIPVITSKFDSLGHVGWYGAAFFTTLCASQPLAGKTFKSYFIHKKDLGSLLCAIAGSSRGLIAGRAIAGFGALGVFAGGLVILTTIVPLHKRAIYTGTMSSTFAVASILGPVLGGSLTEKVSWRGVAAAVFLPLFHVKASATEKTTLAEKIYSLDALGFTLFAGTVTMLLLALQWGGVVYSWGSSLIIGLFVGFGVGLVLFIGWQIRMQDNALIPPALISNNRNVWLICVSSFFVNGPFQTLVYWLPIWFQAVLGVSPTQSGIRYSPTVIADVLASFIGAGIVMKLGVWNPLLLFAHALVCIGAGLLSTLAPGVTDAKWIGYQIFGGIGCAIFLAVGQAVFEDRLSVNLSKVVDPDVISRVIEAGASNVREAVGDSDLPAVLDAYNTAVTQVFVSHSPSSIFDR
ncbi:MFS general substrate transporter [Bimuria novae-zelandiae CBS 107.79]|uniref:MFS general substrate transporter n=1 Tax=Bimuria novae-zelandiae CBS 107.79 TaxID=1447943 RepID=A0A6A5UM46_9PLEO|nr:MFS general substrate transporter [Bimuria novae-zelandiae CBS 107.79]